MCLLCSLVGVLLRHIAKDIFVQIGFVVLVGLAGKTAILIVEFARQLRDEGKSLMEATTGACRLRLRPILMTFFAFILGVLPMVIATGAGAEMRWSLGIAVFSGMLGVTLFGLLLTPAFFFVIEAAGETRHLPPARRAVACRHCMWPVGRAGGGLSNLENRLPAPALVAGRRRDPRAAHGARRPQTPLEEAYTVVSHLAVRAAGPQPPQFLRADGGCRREDTLLQLLVVCQTIATCVKALTALAHRIPGS